MCGENCVEMYYSNGVPNQKHGCRHSRVDGAKDWPASCSSTEFPIPSFIEVFSAKFSGVPPACGPLLQLATAQAGQGNSQNKT